MKSTNLGMYVLYVLFKAPFSFAPPLTCTSPRQSPQPSGNSHSWSWPPLQTVVEPGACPAGTTDSKQNTGKETIVYGLKQKDQSGSPSHDDLVKRINMWMMLLPVTPHCRVAPCSSSAETQLCSPPSTSVATPRLLPEATRQHATIVQNQVRSSVFAPRGLKYSQQQIVSIRHIVFQKDVLLMGLNKTSPRNVRKGLNSLCTL